MKIFSPASVGLFFCEKNLLSFFGVLDTLRYSNGQKKNEITKKLSLRVPTKEVYREVLFLVFDTLVPCYSNRQNNGLSKGKPIVGFIE